MRNIRVVVNILAAAVGVQFPKPTNAYSVSNKVLEGQLTNIEQKNKNKMNSNTNVYSSQSHVTSCTL